jgi:HK97 family phage portal protein
LVGRIARGAERRAVTLANPSEWLVSSLTGGTAYSGKAVSADTALTLVPVFAASGLVAAAVGGVPLKVYDSDRLEARATRQWRLLHETPNDEMAADELWELVAHHLLIWGNSFLLKERDELGLVRQLWPIKPARVAVGREPRSDGRAYRYFVVDGGEKRYYEQDILHIRGLGPEGLLGYSVIQLARQQLGNMLAQDEFQGRFWANGSFMGAALMHPGEMSAPAQERLSQQINRKRGVRETNGLWVFEEDMKLQQLGMPLRDAEFMAQAKMSDLRVAQMFGLVPPHRWGADDGSLTYANAETSGTEFVRWTGRKWWRRIEQSLNRDAGVFPTRTLFSEFVTDDLMRADTKARFETYKLAIDSGIMTANEARRRENLSPIEGGDEIRRPVASA